MSVDPAHASFVVRPFRYSEQSDSAVKALYDDAREIVIESTMDETAASALATTMLAAEKTVQRVFEVDIRDTVSLDEFMTSPPRYTLTDTRTNASGVTCKVVSISTDWRNRVTTLVMKG